VPYDGGRRGFLERLCLVGRYVYLSDAYYGLHVIDVLDPTNPVRVGGLQSADSFHDVSANAGYLYVATTTGMESGALQILDLSTPANPAVVGSVLSGEFLLAVRADGHYVSAYAGANNPVLYLMDAIEPSQPTLLASQPLRADWGLGSRLCSQGNLVLTAAEDGLAFFEISPVLRLNRPLLSGNTLTLSWNGGAGIKLQKTASLTNPIWQDVEGSEGASQLELPRTEAAAFFRLIQP
jgi:hypothetical protein